MSAPSVFAVVLNWNDREGTRDCLRSLAALDYPNLSVVVVDNASADGSIDEFAALDGIDTVRNASNLGFTGGVNAGIRRAMQRGADYVWLVNSDAVMGPGVLSQLVTAAEQDQKIGLVSPVFHDTEPPHAPECLLARYDPVTRIASQTTDPATAAAWAARYPEQITLLGTALLIRRALIETIGLLDDRFFAYVEDVDYSLRASAAGFRNVAVPDAVVYHRFKRPVDNPGGVPPYLHYFMSRNYPLLWRKQPGRTLLTKGMFWFLRGRLLQIAAMTDHPAAVDAVLAGLWDGTRGIGGPYDPRRRMPEPLCSLLGRFPRIWIALMDRRWPAA